MGEDDTDGFYMPVVDEVIAFRYKICYKLGYGTFGTVFSAIDYDTRYQVALKIIRAQLKYTVSGQRELAIIYEVMQSKHHLATYCVEVLDSFMFYNHLVLVFPLYGMSLIYLLRYNEYRGYNMEWTREMSKCIVYAIRLMHRLKIIHSDIKPENIVARYPAECSIVRDHVFVHPPGGKLVLIDFGSAIHFRDAQPALICTRYYRPPEVIIYSSYDEKIDIWSLGCVIYEIATGRTLFRTHNSVIHLAMIYTLLGPMPSQMVRRIRKYGEYYSDGMWQLPEDAPQDELQALGVMNSLEQMTEQFSYNFTHLLKSLLCWDPAQRISCAQILEHPFFVEPSKESKSTQANSILNEVVKSVVNGDISFEDFVRWYRSEFY